MGLVIYSLDSGITYTDSGYGTEETATTRHVIIERNNPIEWRFDYNYDGEWLAGDNFYIVPTQEIKRSAVLRLVVQSIETLNLLAGEQSAANKLRITITGDTTLKIPATATVGLEAFQTCTSGDFGARWKAGGTR